MPPSSSTRLPSISRRLRIPSRAAWLGARAANVRQRPVRLALWWVATFALVGGAFIGLPRLVPWISGGAVVPAAAWPTDPRLLIAASLVLSFFLALVAALLDEMRSPRVASADEAERVTTLRVLATTHLGTIAAHPARRAADRSLPAWLVPSADDYRILSWHLTSNWPKQGVVTVAAEEPFVAALVGANLAAAFATDARATLLVDSDFRHEPVRTLLGLPRSPGLVGVMENKRRWTESLVPWNVGRGRSLLVLPSGVRASPPGPAESQATAGEILRAAKRHDATVVVAPTPQVVTWRAGDDVVLCVMRGVTHLTALSRTVLTLVNRGARVRGLVLWEGPAPRPNSRPPES